MRNLIINADGYGFTKGITRAIEECIEFGTVRSVSANVNFDHAEGLAQLVHRHPSLSVGCHLNPVVGPPLSAMEKVRTLVNGNREFHYKSFSRRFLMGRISLNELHAEMMAQIERTRALAGRAFSHVDFHMGLHRLPGLYEVFLDVAKKSGVGRIRTHRYLVGMESSFQTVRHVRHVLLNPLRMSKFMWNLYLRKKALARGLAMPDRRVEITNAVRQDDRITIASHLQLIRNLPEGFSELVVHPGYLDDDLSRWSTYLHQRERERQVLLSPVFQQALYASDICLAGYRDMPIRTAG